MIEIKLTHPLPVHNKDTGKYENCDNLVVSYKGKSGLKSLKKIQDKIFKSFQEISSNSKPDKTGNSDSRIRAKDMAAMIEMTGHSEEVFDIVSSQLKEFGKIGSSKLTEELQEEMNIIDLEDVCRKVLEHFLFPRISQMLNNMNK